MGKGLNFSTCLGYEHHKGGIYILCYSNGEDLLTQIWAWRHHPPRLGVVIYVFNIFLSYLFNHLGALLGA